MAAGDLTTLEAVRQFLLMAAGDTSKDGELAALITRASRAIGSYTAREFAPATSATARVFAYQGGNVLSLAPYDARTVTAAVLDTDLAAAAQTTLTSSDWRLMPLPARDGVYEWLELPNHDVTGTRARQITVTGTWGWASVPEDVGYAAVITVAMWLRQDLSAFGTNLLLDDDSSERGDPMPRMVGAIPPGARTLLAPYRRMGVA